MGWSPRGDVITVIAPPLPAGAVDVTVTNTDGQSDQLKGGFTYGVAAPLLLERLSVHRGLTAGGTFVSIGGTGFQPGMKVTFGNTEPRLIYTTPGGVMLTTRPHSAGTVDIVVTAADGQVARVDGGYTYVSSQFTEFDGIWEGHVGDEGELAFAFRVENDTVVSVSCGGRTLVLSTLPSTAGGEFAVSGARGANMTGALVEVDQAEGTIDMTQCTYDTVWLARRR